MEMAIHQVSSSSRVEFGRNHGISGNHGVSVYETCACVIHTNLLSYITIVISHYCLRGVHVLREALVIGKLLAKLLAISY